MRSAFITKKGVAIIDNTMDAKMGLIHAAGMSAFCRPSVNNTKPNSPACAKYSAVRRLTPAGAPVRRASTNTKPALRNKGTSDSSSTHAQLSISTSQSSFMPMVMKNRPSSTSWKGRISASTLCLKSVSAISMPAKNAPMASDKPASSVSHASPRVMNSRLSMNSSSLLRRDTMCSQARITRGPPQSSKPTSAAALSIAIDRTRQMLCSPMSASAGMSTSSGTTAKS